METKVKAKVELSGHRHQLMQCEVSGYGRRRGSTGDKHHIKIRVPSIRLPYQATPEQINEIGEAMIELARAYISNFDIQHTSCRIRVRTTQEFDGAYHAL